MSERQNIDSKVNNANGTYWAGLVFFVLVCVLMVYGANKVHHLMQQDKALPVSHLLIEGNTPYTNKVDIVTALKQTRLDNFFQLDVNNVQRQLEALPWVYSASVRKQWPNTLSVYVQDQVPVAVWNGDDLINEHGQIFRADQGRLTSRLPQLFGPEGRELTALENYRDLNKLLKFIDAEIAQIELSERNAWLLTLTNGIALNLGQEDRVMRIQRFMDAYSQIKALVKQQQQVDYIDLRYDTGMAIGWKPLIEEEQTNV
ncbi:cell division protein FtsQ/DivIB [Thalassotalea maritima]|uniref:cell division protein FtsQ/DivIB n=1 Tax=Thalassotalea maritima TaxID=3242416 RepID=UPI003527FBB2